MELSEKRDEEKRRLARLEELRQSLMHKDAQQRAYARQTLLSRLWVEDGTAQTATIAVLLDAPMTGKADAPLAAARLCKRLHRSEADDAPPPPFKELAEWIGRAICDALSESLTLLKTLSRSALTDGATSIPAFQREAEVCRDFFALVRRLEVADAVAHCIRLLRAFPPDTARESSGSARTIMGLRAAACFALGALPPESLFPLWYALGSPDESARRDLLPALDAMQDPRVIPNLVRILERRGQWQDGEMTAWFIVRAFARIGDRAALPALRKVAAGQPGVGLRALLARSQGSEKSGANDLAREARRIIAAIEYGAGVREGQELLRPSSGDTSQLLQPAAPAPGSEEADTLLRPDT